MPDDAHLYLDGLFHHLSPHRQVQRILDEVAWEGVSLDVGIAKRLLVEDLLSRGVSPQEVAKVVKNFVEALGPVSSPSKENCFHAHTLFQFNDEKQTRQMKGFNWEKLPTPCWGGVLNSEKDEYGFMLLLENPLAIAAGIISCDATLLNHSHGLAAGNTWSSMANKDVPLFILDALHPNSDVEMVLARASVGWLLGIEDLGGGILTPGGTSAAYVRSALSMHYSQKYPGYTSHMELSVLDQATLFSDCASFKPAPKTQEQVIAIALRELLDTAVSVTDSYSRSSVDGNLRLKFLTPRGVVFTASPDIALRLLAELNKAIFGGPFTLARLSQENAPSSIPILSYIPLLCEYKQPTFV